MAFLHIWASHAFLAGFDSGEACEMWEQDIVCCMYSSTDNTTKACCCVHSSTANKAKGCAANTAALPTKQKDVLLTQQRCSQLAIPVDFTLLARPQGAKDRVLVGGQNPAQAGFEVTGIKGCQKPQGAHAEANDRWQGRVFHKLGSQVQHCAVTP